MVQMQAYEVGQSDVRATTPYIDILGDARQRAALEKIARELDNDGSRWIAAVRRTAATTASPRHRRLRRGVQGAGRGSDRPPRGEAVLAGQLGEWHGGGGRDVSGAGPQRCPQGVHCVDYRNQRNKARLRLAAGTCSAQVGGLRLPARLDLGLESAAPPGSSKSTRRSRRRCARGVGSRPHRRRLYAKRSTRRRPASRHGRDRGRVQRWQGRQASRFT